MQWSAPVSSTAATAHAPTCWCSTLRAPIPRACAVPDSPPPPIVSRDSNVTCVVPTCRCRAEGSVPRLCRNTLSSQAGFLSALPQSLPSGCLVYDGLVPAPDLSASRGPHRPPSDLMAETVRLQVSFQRLWRRGKRIAAIGL